MREHAACSTGKAIVEIERAMKWLLNIGMIKEAKSYRSIVEVLDEHREVIFPSAKKYSNNLKNKDES